MEKGEEKWNNSCFMCLLVLNYIGLILFLMFKFPLCSFKNTF